MAINDFLSLTLWNNTGQQYLTAILIFIAVILIIRLTKIFVVSYLKRIAAKTKTHIDDIIVDVLAAINWPFYTYIAFYVATRFLTVQPEILDRVFYFLFIIIAIYYVGRIAQRIIDHFINVHVEKRKEKGGASILRVLGLILKISIWVLAILLIMANLGIEITPLIAGLGIGGIAIAFALQGILEDLFAAFSIYLDKPFVEGDFIIIGSDMGVIKHIGLKSTRLQTLQGQELVVSNHELTSTRVNNYKKMQKRRILFAFGVEYDTPTKKLKKINNIVNKIVEDQKLATLDRVHFKEFGDFSLNYEVVYYLDSKEYNDYMNTQQEINFNLKDAFEKEGIVFAFPTQTIHVQK